MSFQKKIIAKLNFSIVFLLLSIALLLGMYIFTKLNMANTPKIKKIHVSSVYELKKNIAKEYPLIYDPKTSNFERVNMLREWASAQILWGSDSTNINNFFYGKDLAESLNIFYNNLGSVNCGIAANVLMKLYEVYGYKAYTYHVGNLDEFNHAVTLVEIPYKNRKILMIQDPSFDLIFTDKNGEPYEFYTFLQSLKKKDIKNIYIVQGEGKPHYYLCDNKDQCNENKVSRETINLSSTRKKYPEKFTTHRIANNIYIFLINRGVFPKENPEAVTIENKVRKILE